MVYTKEEFKRIWEDDVAGIGDIGITYEDCRDCAKAWALDINPRLLSIWCSVSDEEELVREVCKAAGCNTEQVAGRESEQMERTMYVIKREDGTFYWRGNASSQYGWKGFDEAALFNTRRGAESRMYISNPLKCEVKKVKITLID